MKIITFSLSLVLLGSACSPKPEADEKSEGGVKSNTPQFSITARDVITASAQVVTGRIMSSPEKETTVLQVELTEERAEAFRKFTKEHIGQKVEFLVDGKVVAAPVVNDEILGGKLELPSSPDEARKVAASLSRK